MSDERIRRAEREAQSTSSPEAQAKLLRETMRAGELNEERVDLAARLGHAAALMLCPDAPSLNWSDFSEMETAIQQAEDHLGTTLPVRVAVDWAERALPLLEGPASNPEAPRAVAAAKAWLDCPCDEHAEQATDLGDALYLDLEIHGISTASMAINAAAWSAISVRGASNDARGYATNAFDPIPFAPGMERRPGRAAAEAAAYAFYSVSAAHDHGVDESLLLRLAAYLLGEVS